jgi:hypothetical protein
MLALDKVANLKASTSVNIIACVLLLVRALQVTPSGFSQGATATITACNSSSTSTSSSTAVAGNNSSSHGSAVPDLPQTPEGTGLLVGDYLFEHKSYPPVYLVSRATSKRTKKPYTTTTTFMDQGLCIKVIRRQQEKPEPWAYYDV